MGVSEIREKLGVSRQWAYVIIGRKGFPDHVVELAMGRAWLAEDVEQWIAQHRHEIAEDPESDPA